MRGRWSFGLIGEAQNDLALTCNSETSRNFRHGLALAGAGAEAAGTTVEGAATAKAITQLAREDGLELPLCATVAALCAGTLTVDAAVAGLLARPLKEE